MSNAIGREAGEGSTPKKRLKTKSPVWEHFTKVKVEGVTKAKCNYCNEDLSYTGGTTTHLKRHLRSCSKVPNGGITLPTTIAENNERAAMNQLPTIAFGEADINMGLTREKIWEVQVKNAIMADILFAPPNIKKAWSSLMVMDMEKEILAYHQEEKKKLFDQLEKLTSRVCLSIEITDETGWYAITAHFINDDFKLAKRVIGFKKILHASVLCVEYIDFMESCIRDWKFKDNIFSFTTNLKDFDILNGNIQSQLLLNGDNDTFYLPCFKESIVESYSDNWQQTFSDEADKTFKIVNNLRDWWGFDFVMIAKEKGLPPIKDLFVFNPIFQSVDTHIWKYCCSVSKRLEEELLYKEVFCELSLREPASNINPDCIRWTELEKAVNYIKAINTSIDLLYNFKYPTSNLYFQNFIKIRDSLDDAATFLQIFSDVFDSMIIFCVACILDPRFKLRFFEHLLSNEGSDFWPVKADKIREFFDILFGIYTKEETNQASPLTIGTANTQEGCPSSSFTNQGVSRIIDTYPLYIKELRTTNGEVNRYLNDEMVDVEDTNFDLLGWWKQNRSRYPVLSRMARDFLAVPACIYSVQENLKIDLSVLEGVDPELVEAAICLKDWILSDV